MQAASIAAERPTLGTANGAGKGGTRILEVTIWPVQRRKNRKSDAKWCILMHSRCDILIDAVRRGYFTAEGAEVRRGELNCE